MAADRELHVGNVRYLYSFLVTSVVVLSLLFGCSDELDPGVEGGPCDPKSGCFSGLTCLSGRCVRLPDAKICTTCKEAGPCPDAKPCPTCKDAGTCPDAKPCPTCKDAGTCPDAKPCPTCKDAGTCPDAKPCPACPDASVLPDLHVADAATKPTWKAHAWPSGVTKTSLLDVWGVSSSDVWAVGNGGIILHYDGSTWKQQKSPVTEVLRSIYGTGATEVYAVGANNSIVSYDAKAKKWVQQTVANKGTAMHFQDVFVCKKAGEPWAIGHNGISGYIYIYKSKQASWIQATCPSCYQYKKPFYGTWSDCMWSMDVVVGHQGYSSLCNSTSCTYPYLHGVHDLRDVFGLDQWNFFAVGLKGTILKWNSLSNKWVSQASSTNQHLYGIWGTSPTHLVVVGGGGTILDAQWKPQKSGTTATLTGVWGTGPTDVFVVGYSGTILHYGL